MDEELEELAGRIKNLERLVTKLEKIKNSGKCRKKFPKEESAARPKRSKRRIEDDFAD